MSAHNGMLEKKGEPIMWAPENAALNGPRFDAYTATTSEAAPVELVDHLRAAVFGSWEVKQGRGFHGFRERVSFLDNSGTEGGAVSWGGRHGALVMVEGKGEVTPELVTALRSGVQHRATRVDSCADFDGPRAFQRLYRPCRAVKKAHRLIGGKAGDWEDHPELGRTFYLGSAKSPVRARMYEKGKQPEYSHLGRADWVRLEVQVRPRKEQREVYAGLSPLEVWGASKWTRQLAAIVLDSYVNPHPPGTVYRLGSTERAMRWMTRQYAHHLLAYADDLGGPEALGLTLHDMAKEALGDERLAARSATGGRSEAKPKTTPQH